MLISAKDIINQTFELYQKNYKIFLKYISLLFIPTSITALTATLLGKFLTVIETLGFSVPLLIYLLIIILSSLANIWVDICLIKIISKILEGTANHLDLKEELANNAHLILPVILVSILTSLIIFGGCLLFIIPAIIFYIWIKFAKLAVILEQANPLTALKISKNLVKERWWKVCWRLLAPAVVFTLMLFFVQWLIVMPIEVILNNFNFNNIALTIILIIYTLLAACISILFLPLYNTALIILYKNLKATPQTTNHLEPPQI